MIEHDGETVKLKLARVTIAEESADEEFSILRTLEVAVTPIGQDRDGVGAGMLADSGHEERAYTMG